MSATSIKAALLIASAALASMAIAPALAQQETQAPPPEIQELPTKSEAPHSKPVITKETPRELQLRPRAMPPRKCRSDAGTKADAEAYCGPILQCPSGTVVSCSYRSNNQDWICSCK